jgi:hypothetical protein
MMSPVAILVLGFFLGMRHSTDPDHVVAVSTLVSRGCRTRAAAAVGALWGIGHTFTILLVGGAIIVFGLVVPAELGLSMEMAVAVMLVVLGVMNVSGTMPGIGEDAYVHHADSRAHGTRVAGPCATSATMGAFKPFTIGVIHGMAGSAAVALLVLSTIREPRWAFFYLLVFGVGTVAGMMLLTMSMIVPISFLIRRFGPIEVAMARATGLLSVAFGLLLAYRVGFIDGLLTGHPHWIPK